MVFYYLFDLAAYTLGSYYAFCVLLWAIYEIYPYVTKPFDLKQRYGDKTWAVVTGASDGIGLAYCNEFASLGFNVVMIARTKDKLEKAAANLAKQYGVETKAIAADFSLCTQNPETFFGNITSQLESLPVSILVNNVGFGAVPKRFINETTENICTMNSLNLWPILYLSHFVVNQLLTQKRRGAVINLSSIAGNIPGPISTLYSPGKSYDDFFSRTQFEEYGDQIDFLSVRPGFVSTPLTNHMKVKFDVCMPDQCVKPTLRHLGKSPYTSGYPVHCLFGFLLPYVPGFVIAKLAKAKTLKKELTKKDN